MIFLTGDIHGQPQRLGSYDFPEGKNLTKDDYVIILGDFGIIWEKDETTGNERYWLDWLENKPWTTLFIAGNHENYDRLEDYSKFPVEEWHGGMAQKIRPSVIHLCYGEIFDIDGYKFLNLEGAASHDIEHGIIDPSDYKTREDMKAACRRLEAKYGGWRFARYRIKGESWWPQEIPNEIKRNNALLNLSFVNNKVDFVLSHEGPASDVILLGQGYYKPEEYSIWLENIRQTIDYKKWFFGHYHYTKRITDKEMCLYEDIERIV